MRISLYLVIAAMACLVIAEDSVYAQSASGATPSPSRQELSHQMNQPPPDLGERYRISDEMLDEIRELYAMAQKELGARNRGKTKNNK